MPVFNTKTSLWDTFGKLVYYKFGILVAGTCGGVTGGFILTPGKGL